MFLQAPSEIYLGRGLLTFVLLSFFSFQGTFCYYVSAIFMPIAGIAGLSRDSHFLCVFNVVINKKRFNHRWMIFPYPSLCAPTLSLFISPCELNVPQYHEPAAKSVQY